MARLRPAFFEWKHNNVNIKTQRKAARHSRVHALGTLAISIALAFGMAPFDARAQEAVIQVSIPAQPLGQALLQLGQQTSLQIFYPQELVNGLSAPRVSGNVTPEQALRQLLQGTGIEYSRQGNSVTLSRPVSTTELAPVIVTGSTGDLSPAYAGGLVATGSRVGMLGNKDFMETPFSTIAYTEDAITNRQSDNILNVIADSDPGVSLTGGNNSMGNYSNTHIRGFNSGSRDMGYDGLYGLGSYTGRYVGVFAERVEVLKGPSALLNGMLTDGAVGGAVNVMMKRATDSPLTRLTAGYESDSQWRTHIDIGRRLGEQNRFGIRFNAMKQEGEPAVDGKDRNNHAVGLGLDYRGDRFRLSADLLDYKERTDGVTSQTILAPSLTQVPAPPTHSKIIAGEPWTYWEGKGQMALLNLDVDISESTSAWIKYGAGRSKMRTFTLNWTIEDLDGDFSRSHPFLWNIDQRSSAGDVGMRSKFETGPIKHEVVLNANASSKTEYWGQDRTIRYPGITGGNIYNPTYLEPMEIGSSPSLTKNSVNKLYSYGISDTLSFLDDRVQLTVGARRQTVDTSTFNAATGERNPNGYKASATTPAAALLVQLNDQVSVYGNYIEGLSAGRRAPDTAVNAGEIFPPYKTKQQEVGVKYDAGSFATTVALFQIKRPNAYTDPTTNVFSAGGEQRNRGVEWNAFGEPIQGFRLMGGVAWTQAKLTKTAGGVNQGNTAAEVPKFIAKLGVEYDIGAIPGLTLSANAIHTGSQYLDQTNKLSIPSWRRYDLGARYATKVAGKSVMLRANVLNVTNNSYWYGALWRGVSDPRTFMLSASIDF